MFIVLLNRQEGNQMTDHHDTQPTPPAAGHDGEQGQRGPSPTQLAAVVEAAYILEAVRK
jgi:hypothetical protein